MTTDLTTLEIQMVAEIKRLKEIEEEWITTCANLTKELAALKAQASEPKWWHHVDASGRDIFMNMPCDLPDETPLYVLPPQAEALVADFKRRAVEVCEKDVDHDMFGMPNQAWGIMKGIDSLPLIGEM